MLFQLPRGTGDRFVVAAREADASFVTRVPGSDGQGGGVELFVVTVPNAAAGPLIQQAESLGRVEVSMVPSGAMAFEPPTDEPSEQLLDVTSVSAFEVVLQGLQATGSWKGFLTYAATAGVVVWLGLFTETVYLLTGSMLIAPFAGPAMNTAIAVAAGRPQLLRHSLLRYALGISLTAAVSGALTLAAGMGIATSLMTDVMTITTVAVLLPLAAGVAGASFLAQSEHSSLISGAAVGVLVAASLTPPAGGVGMALALGRVDLAMHGVFLIALQLTGITASAVLVLWLYGVRPGTVRFSGRHPLLLIGGAVAAVLTVALLVLQGVTAPELVQGSRSRDAVEVVNRVLQERGDVTALAVETDVAAAGVEGPPRILAHVSVERRPGAAPADQLQADLRADLTDALRRELGSVVVHPDVTVHEAP